MSGKIILLIIKTILLIVKNILLKGKTFKEKEKNCSEQIRCRRYLRGMGRRARAE